MADSNAKNVRELDSDPSLTGSTAGARCAQLDSINDGDIACLVLPDHPNVKVYVRVVEHEVYNHVLTVSASTMGRLEEAAGTRPRKANVRRLTPAERVGRKVTLKHAAAFLAVFAAILTCWIALASLWSRPSTTELTTVKDRLTTAATWPTGQVLSAADLQTIGQARQASEKVTVGSDSSPTWLKTSAAISVLAAAAATFTVVWKAADR